MSMPDKKGHFGIYGGTFAPETLMPALAELENAYLAAKKDKGFRPSWTTTSRSSSAGPRRSISRSG